MSRHTWLTRPTQAKADRLLEAFRAGIAAGFELAGYSQCFANHVPFWVRPIAVELGLDPKTPALIVADKLEDLGDGRASEVRSWVE